MKKKYITEAGFFCTVISGALYAYVEIVSTALNPMMQAKGIAAFLGSIGIALIGYRVSKKLGEPK
jgi:hypothetical protein